MNIILAADGHVGSATAKALLKKGKPVTVVLHSDARAAEWKQFGAAVAVADINDSDMLHEIFRQGSNAFILNPPAPPAGDPVATELASIRSILRALEKSGLEKIVAESTYGAQQGDQIGDLGTLYALEKGLHATGIPTTVLRGAYYMSNWDMAAKTARDEGVVHTLYPADFMLPMVSPEDIGQFAADVLLEPVGETGLRFVEGPEKYSSHDVADAFSKALGKPVQAVQTAPEDWMNTLKTQGFSPLAAASMAAMTRITLENGAEKSDKPFRGKTTLQEYVFHLTGKAPKPADSPGPVHLRGH